MGEKRQIIFIHGGETFDTYEDYLEFLRGAKYYTEPIKKWKHSLQEDLGDEFKVMFPLMPGGQNDKYIEWEIWFKKVLPFIEDGAVLMGHSLGGIFLAKFLAENKIEQKIRATYLIAAPFNEEISKHSLADFKLPDSLDAFSKQGGKIYLYQSKDDNAVPYESVERYAELLSDAKLFIFEDRGHFLQEEFSEIIESIKNLY